MSYENKEYILQFFEGVHEKENRAELIEVYRKAKAFDKIDNAYGNTETTRMLKYFEAVKVINNFYESGEPNV